MIHTALTVAGSDPSGGAGIQADLKTFTSLDVYGMSVIAAVTAQNTLGVRDVMQIPAEFIGLQMDAVFTDITPAAMKTGMLGTAAAVDIVAHKVRRHGLRNLIVDPVMVRVQALTCWSIPVKKCLSTRSCLLRCSSHRILRKPPF